jgi:lipopolysaccharide/colanic/teichoic acid biosynthesis glycosyltransferase
LVFKRLTDITVSAASLLVLAPVLAVIGVAVRSSSGPPILFRQIRVGKGRRPFVLLKFRTMVTASARVASRQVDAADQEVTAVGRILRRFKLDELPQLMNVLRGDMSLVGPRPVLLETVAGYDPRQSRRLEVRPGLTGLAQVNGNTTMSWDERINFDLHYLDHMSLRTDLDIIRRTFGVIARGEGHYARDFDAFLASSREGRRDRA